MNEQPVVMQCSIVFWNMVYVIAATDMRGIETEWRIWFWGNASKRWHQCELPVLSDRHSLMVWDDGDGPRLYISDIVGESGERAFVFRKHDGQVWHECDLPVDPMRGSN